MPSVPRAHLENRVIMTSGAATQGCGAGSMKMDVDRVRTKSRGGQYTALVAWRPAVRAKTSKYSKIW